MVITYTKISGHQVLAALIGKFFGISVQEVSAEEAEQIADPFKYLYDVWVKCRESYTLKKLKENTTIPPVLAVFSPISVEATNEQRAQWQEIAKAVETFIVLEFSEFETDADALKRAFGMLYVVDQSEIRLPIAEIISTGRAYCRSFELLERKRAKAVADLKTLLTESADADFSEEVKSESASANAVQNPDVLLGNTGGASVGDAELKNFKAPEEQEPVTEEEQPQLNGGDEPGTENKDIDELKDKVD